MHDFLQNTARDAGIFATGSFLTLTPPGELAGTIFTGIGVVAKGLDYMFYPEDPLITSLTEVLQKSMRADPPYDLLTDELVKTLTDQLKKKKQCK